MPQSKRFNSSTSTANNFSGSSSSKRMSYNNKASSISYGRSRNYRTNRPSKKQNFNSMNGKSTSVLAKLLYCKKISTFTALFVFTLSGAQLYLANLISYFIGQSFNADVLQHTLFAFNVVQFFAVYYLIKKIYKLVGSDDLLLSGTITASLNEILPRIGRVITLRTMSVFLLSSCEILLAEYISITFGGGNESIFMMVIFVINLGKFAITYSTINFLFFVLTNKNSNNKSSKLITARTSRPVTSATSVNKSVSIMPLHKSDNEYTKVGGEYVSMVSSAGPSKNPLSFGSSTSPKSSASSSKPGSRGISYEGKSNQKEETRKQNEMEEVKRMPRTRRYTSKLSK